MLVNLNILCLFCINPHYTRNYAEFDNKNSASFWPTLCIIKSKLGYTQDKVMSQQSHDTISMF